MGIINTQAVADGRKVRTGKDGALYNGKGKLLATVEVFQAQMGVANQKYHPLGTPLEQEILDSIGTTLTFTECVVEREQKRQENMKLYVAAMKKLGLKKAPKEANTEFYSNKWERMQEYSLDKEPPKEMKFKDNGEQIFYLERYGNICVIRKAKKEKKVLSPAEEAKKQNMRNKKQIKAILKEAANTRKVFIEGILSGRIDKVTDEKQVEADLFEQMMHWEAFAGHNKLIQFFVGCEVYNAPKEEIEAAKKKMQGLSVLQKLLCLVSAMVADADLVEWNYTYSTIRGEKVKAFYKVLEQYGFRFLNDEEKDVVEGTSGLYVKKEGTE